MIAQTMQMHSLGASNRLSIRPHHAPAQRCQSGLVNAPCCGSRAPARRFGSHGLLAQVCWRRSADGQQRHLCGVASYQNSNDHCSSTHPATNPTTQRTVPAVAAGATEAPNSSDFDDLFDSLHAALRSAAERLPPLTSLGSPLLAASTAETIKAIYKFLANQKDVLDAAYLEERAAKTFHVAEVRRILELAKKHEANIDSVKEWCQSLEVIAMEAAALERFASLVNDAVADNTTNSLKESIESERGQLMSKLLERIREIESILPPRRAASRDGSPAVGAVTTSASSPAAASAGAATTSTVTVEPTAPVTPAPQPAAPPAAASVARETPVPVESSAPVKAPSLAAVTPSSSKSRKGSNSNSNSSSSSSSSSNKQLYAVTVGSKNFTSTVFKTGLLKSSGDNHGSASVSGADRVPSYRELNAALPHNTPEMEAFCKAVGIQGPLRGQEAYCSKAGLDAFCAQRPDPLRH